MRPGVTAIHVHPAASNIVPRLAPRVVPLRGVVSTGAVADFHWEQLLPPGGQVAVREILGQRIDSRATKMHGATCLVDVTADTLGDSLE